MNSTVAAKARIVGANDRVTVYGWKALAGSVIGYSMDGVDLLIVSFMLHVYLRGLRFDKRSSGIAYHVDIDGCGGGWIHLWDHERPFRPNPGTHLDHSDIRRIHGLLWLGAGLLGPVAYRTLAGLGLGGEFGIGMALAAEPWPPSKRARVSCYVALGWQAGVLVAAFATPCSSRRLAGEACSCSACYLQWSRSSSAAHSTSQKFLSRACCQKRELLSIARKGSEDTRDNAGNCHFSVRSRSLAKTAS